MHLHEYQAKMILKEYGVPIPDFAVISSLEQVDSAREQLDLQKAVLKIQVHAGGRGKAGGVVVADSPEAIKAAAKKLLGMRIVNNQTGKEGIVASEILITQLVDIKKEFYVGVAIDREKGQAVLIASPEGGVEIEEIAEKTPEKIKIIPINRQGKLRNYQLLEIVNFMGWKGETAVSGKQILTAIVQAFIASDAMLLEINPLIETPSGDLYALDAKLSIDENALFRQPVLAECYDPTQLPKNEAEAHQHDLAYVALDGSIGCMVNGAGLAMATMDIIQHYGGSPANFLDVGGSASQDKIAEGFKIILSDPKVKAILINIFGGIMNCVTLAAGVVSACSSSNVHVPLIIRMEGTHVEQGKQILQDSGLNIILADTLTEAAEKAVQASKRRA